MADIYNFDFVEKLFDEMSDTYETVNYITSFGFSRRWRNQFVKKVDIKTGMVVCDMMCGMGECWLAVAANLSPNDHLLAIDFSDKMLQHARKQSQKFPHLNIQIHKQNALANTLADESVDCIISGFGLKTFSNEQKKLFASEIKRILKPKGTFSLVEISVPQGWLLKKLYMFYLKQIIPILGRILLGNPDNYRMLGIYTEKFGNCEAMKEILLTEGLQVTYHQYFFGCASGISGIKV